MDTLTLSATVVPEATAEARHRVEGLIAQAQARRLVCLPVAIADPRPKKE